MTRSVSWRRTLFFTAFCTAILGCSSEAVTLVNLDSGAITKCSATGAGLGTGWARTFVDSCIARYRSLGYVPLDELTAEQRADLQKRGGRPTD
jgi:hypothetical protein